MQFLSESAIFYINGEKVDGRDRRILRHNDVVSSASRTIFEYRDRRRYRPDVSMPEKIRTDYHFVTELGSGSSATVFHVYRRGTLTTYAIKNIEKKRSEIEKSDFGCKEASILRELEHCGITRLIDYIESPESTVLVLELMHGGNLLKRIEKHKHLPEKLCAFYFYQIANAVEYLHAQKVTHRDIKPENILLKTANDYTVVKLTDFGLAKINAEMRTRCGTSAYVAPEVLKEGSYMEKVDVWGMGVVLYSALSGTLPFGHSDNRHTQDKIREAHFEFDSPTWQNISLTAQDFIRLMLRKDAHIRPSACRLIHDKWFYSYENEISHAERLMEEERSAILIARRMYNRHEPANNRSRRPGH